jgi:polysaccharide biosynthesis/export protein
MTAKSPSKNIAERVRPVSIPPFVVAVAIGLSAVMTSPAFGQARQTPPPRQTPSATPPSALPPTVPAPAPPAAAPNAAAPVAVPPGYTIGPEDVLSIVFWRDKDMSAEVSVRPDGKISLPLLNDVDAAGLTPTELKDRLVTEAKRYVEDASVTVVVKQINSRRVFVIGEVAKPGVYALTGAPTTVLQFISIAGGLREYAKANKILIMRTENGKPVSHKFNYEEVIAGKKLQQNIELKPGDTIVIP